MLYKFKSNLANTIRNLVGRTMFGVVLITDVMVTPVTTGIYITNPYFSHPSRTRGYNFLKDSGGTTCSTP